MVVRLSPRRPCFLVSHAVGLLAALVIAAGADGCSVTQPVNEAALATAIPAMTPVPPLVWTTTGRPRAARSSHTATLLADGALLIVGGVGTHERLADAIVVRLA